MESSYASVPASVAGEGAAKAELEGLLEYWHMLRRRKSTLILTTFLGAVAGVLVTLPQTPIYQARTSLEIVGLNENFMNIKQVSPVTETGSSSELAILQTHIKVLQSESLIERVLAGLDKNKPPEEAKRRKWLSTVRKMLNIPQPPPDPREEALRKAMKNLKVRPVGQTRIIEIFYDSPDPRRAADFANTLTNDFIEQNLESRWKTTERTGEWLTHQLDDMRIKLERSEDQLQRYARNSGLMFTSEENNVSEDKLRQLQQELSKAQTERVARQSRYDMARTSPPETLPDVLNDTGLRAYQAKLTDLRRQLADLSPTYTEEYYKVQRLQAQVLEVETALMRERAAVLTRITNEFEEAQRKEKLLAAAYDAQTKLVMGESEKAIQYTILKREVESNRQLYEAMLQRLKEASIASAMRASNIRVVDPAKPPRLPHKPDIPLSAAGGLAAGFLFGIAAVILSERADRSLQEPGDAYRYLNLPELGVVPSGLPEMGRFARFQRSRGASAERSLGSLGQSVDRVELATWQRKESMLAEAFRSTLVSILFSAENGDRARVLVLTSSSPGEGKSTVSSNLAIAIAEVGQRVLLIDGDMRKPRLHDIFSVPNSPGLSDMLRERKPLDEKLSQPGLIRETGVPGLFLLTGGAGTSAAINLMYRSEITELLKRFRREFDTVLIDTPPMLQIPDARVLSRMADGVILVLRAGHTTRDAALAARQRFAEDGTRVLGTILNDWNRRSAGYYGYYYSGYHSYYGDQHK